VKLKLTLLATILTISHLFGFGQEVTLKGKLLDYENKHEIIGASVIPDTYKNGALTDKNGQFEIKDNTKGLEIYFVGCYPVKLRNIPAGQTSIDLGEIKMLTNHLEEGMMIGGPSVPPNEETIAKDKALKEAMLTKYYLKVLGHTLKPSFDGKFFVYDFQKQAGIKQ
jgi:hypothetical protein